MPWWNGYIEQWEHFIYLVLGKRKTQVQHMLMKEEFVDIDAHLEGSLKKLVLLGALL
jgi:hypothetical protein